MIDTILRIVSYFTLRLRFMPKMRILDFTLRLRNATGSNNVDACLDLEWTIVYKVNLPQLKHPRLIIAINLPDINRQENRNESKRLFAPCKITSAGFTAARVAQRPVRLEQRRASHLT